MLGREKVESALDRGGTPQIPAVIPYEGIFQRDHWPQITECPWWYAQSPELKHQLAWRRDAILRTGSDWYVLPDGEPSQVREALEIVHDGNVVMLLDRRTGERRRLEPPRIGGWTVEGSSQSIHTATLPETLADVEAAIPLDVEPRSPDPHADGSGDLAAHLLHEFGSSHYPIRHVSAPVWSTYRLWGFEGMMILIATRPDLVQHACRRTLARALQAARRAAALGAAGIWIEDCFTDMIRPADFAQLNGPPLRTLVDEIRRLGMRSIYYYCGDPSDRWEAILSIGADAVSLEESKKRFRIDIDEVVGRAAGRCAVLGNLDAVGVLQDADEGGLAAEIIRQLAAGRRNSGRFIMSLGSPVTPGTPLDRVRRYGELVRELGGVG